MKATLIDSLKKLRLSGLLESLEVRIHEAKSGRLDYDEFLELILQDELAIRQDHLIARRTKAARFRDQKSLEDFDWDFNRSIKRKQIHAAGGGQVPQRRTWSFNMRPSRNWKKPYRPGNRPSSNT